MKGTYRPNRGTLVHQGTRLFLVAGAECSYSFLGPKTFAGFTYTESERLPVQNALLSEITRGT
jgi:hypothetical protein